MKNTFLVTLIICAIIEGTSHNLYHDHFLEGRPQVNFGFPLASDTNRYGRQSGLHRRHLQDTGYANFHTATHRHGTHSHFGSVASRVDGFNNHHMDRPLTFYARYGVLNSRRNNQFTTTSSFNYLSPQNRVKYSKIEETHGGKICQNGDQGRNIKIKTRPFNKVDAASRILNVDLEDLAEAGKQFKNDVSRTSKPRYDFNQDMKNQSQTTTEINEVTEINDLTGDRWTWDDGGDEVEETSTSTTEKFELHNRVSFDGDCPKGMIRVFGICVAEDK